VSKKTVSKNAVSKILDTTKVDTPKVDTPPPATQTKPGLLSYKSFNQKNHSADNTPSHRLLPTKKARQLPWAVFCLQADALNQVTGEHRSETCARIDLR
jgi:hypothetical protein